MFGKLLKHELGATGRTLAPIYGAVLILAGLTSLLARVGRMGLTRPLVMPAGSAAGVGSDLLYFFVSILSILLVLCLFATVIITFVLHITRFYRMLGDEGYLAFTLPVTAGQQLGAKLLSAQLWTLGAELVTVGCAAMLFWGSRIPRAPDGSHEVVGFGDLGFARSALVLGALFLMLLLGMAGVYLMMYLSCAVGSQWPQNRMMASVIAFVILGTALQILALVGLAVFAFSGAMGPWLLWATSGTLTAADFTAVLAGVFGVLGIILLVLDAAGFFMTRWLLTKKLNLA